VAPVPRLAEAIEAAETHVDRTTTALWSLRCQSTAQARAAGITPEAWDSLVVVSAVPPGDLGERQRVAALADQPRKAVALVAPQPAGQPPVGRTITIGPDGWLRIDGVDAPVWPHRLEEEDAGIVVALLDLATRREDVAAEEVDEPEVRRAPAPAVPAAAWPDPVAGTAMAGPEEPGREPRPGRQPDDLLPPEGPAAGPDAPGAVIVGRDGVVPTGPAAGNGDLPAAARLAGDEDPSAADAPALAADSAAADAEDPDDRGPGGGLGLGAAGPDADLASAAGEDPPQPAGEPVGDPGATPDLLPVPVRRLDALLEEVEVLVRVLGEVEAVRRDRETGEEERLVPVRQKALEAISYLALRESTVDREDLEVNLFPDGANAAKTVYNTVSAARALVGEELFPPIESGRYSLSERVVTDYGLFCDLVAQADETDDALLAADLLTDALSLVRGEPFTGVGRSYAWVGPHRGMIVAQVVDAAEELAEVRLAMNDWRSAEWAARRGLRAFPSDERMYRLLMRAARAAGNVPGVQRVFRELCDVIADPDLGVEPEDTLHPETVALLEELTGITPRHGQMGA
jgi:DNA-binding SARP family transcriptional activator